MATLHRARLKARRTLERILLARRIGRLRDAPGRPGPGGRRVAVVHYWDTRPRFRSTWPLNAPVMEHNLRVLEAHAPAGFAVEHFIVLHEVSDIPAVEELLARLRDAHAIKVLRHRLDLTRFRHPHKFNYVAAHSHRLLRPDLTDFTHVFTTSADMVLANHTGHNLLDLMIEVVEGDRGQVPVHEQRPGARYVSHTIAATPDWVHFTHNAAIQKGLFALDRMPFVELAAERSMDWIPAENHLGEVLGEHCAYLRPHERIYHGDFPLEELTRERADDLLDHVTTAAGTRSLVGRTQGHWAGAIRWPRPTGSENGPGPGPARRMETTA